MYHLNTTMVNLINLLTAKVGVHNFQEYRSICTTALHTTSRGAVDCVLRSEHCVVPRNTTHNQSRISQSYFTFNTGGQGTDVTCMATLEKNFFVRLFVKG